MVFRGKDFEVGGQKQAVEAVGVGDPQGQDGGLMIGTAEEDADKGRHCEQGLVHG